MKVRPFLVPVSPSGLPKNWCYLEASQKADSVILVEKETLAKVYWLLEKVSIAYTFIINGKKVERSFSLTTDLAPLYRAERAPIFELTEEAFYLEVDLSNVSKTGNAWGIPIRIEEENMAKTYRLSLNKSDDYYLLANKTFTLFKTPLTLYLYGAYKKDRGTIDQFNIEFDYIEIDFD